MSKIDTINSKSNLDCVSDELFTELTPEAAEVVQGGASFSSTVNFDTLLYSREFSNDVGDKIQMTLNTSSAGNDNPNNDDFGVELQSYNNGKWTTAAEGFLPINGGGTFTWGGLRNDGELLRLKFTDEQDGEFITGTINVYD